MIIETPVMGQRPQLGGTNILNTIVAAISGAVQGIQRVTRPTSAPPVPPPPPPSPWGTIALVAGGGVLLVGVFSMMAKKR